MGFASFIYKLILVVVGLIASILALGWLAITVTSLIYTPLLPSTDKLLEAQLNLPLRIYSSDGMLMAEFGAERRAPLKYDELPPQLIEAFLAAEDDRFFEHPGFDYQGLLRASMSLLMTGKKTQGGSTITMQLARNYFLGHERTYSRKIKEIMLAMKIEREFDKRQILELYLNKIYLGNHAYGVGAAAQIYYGKEVGKLSLAQMAMIAGLPKAPSKFNPVANPQRALLRRDYVLRRMRELRFITQEEYENAQQEPVSAHVKLMAPDTIDADYVSEMVRAEMFARYGEAAYTDGYVVITTLNSGRQDTANRALRRALQEYEQRHGYRGAEGKVEIKDGNDAIAALDAALGSRRSIGGLQPAVVAEAGPTPRIYIRGYGLVKLTDAAMAWAGPGVARRFKRGSLIRVTATGDVDKPWQLAQLPRVQGALVTLDPHDGAIEALVGGFDFQFSKFNRVVQAQRQPGSAFKPLLYAAALEKGFTPASIINDAPVVFDLPGVQGEWRPENYSGKFYGPTRLREALVHSRNLVSIRLLMAMGIDYAYDFILRFGLAKDRLPRNFSMALGTATVTPLELARAYASFANGGYLVQPYYIREIQRADGRSLYKAAPQRVCADCPPPQLPEVASPQTMYLMTSMMHDVIERGTAVAAKSLGRADLAGKTGTTNDMKDTWFSGFNSDLVTTCWIGFDQLQPLGKDETGAKAALPMWMYFMGEVLKGAPESTMPRPDGLVTVRISPYSGQLASSTSTDAIFETFPEDRVPSMGSGDGGNTTPANGGGRVDELF